MTSSNFEIPPIPIIGIGGIANANDVIEFILAGANFVQIGTSNYTNPNIGIEIIEELQTFCINNNINTLSDLRGQVIYHD